MRSIIHDQVSHKFIEGPLPSIFANNLRAETETARPADFSRDYESREDVNDDIYDRDIPYYSMNERQD